MSVSVISVSVIIIIGFCCLAAYLFHIFTEWLCRTSKFEERYIEKTIENMAEKGDFNMHPATFKFIEKHLNNKPE